MDIYSNIDCGQERIGILRDVNVESDIAIVILGDNEESVYTLYSQVYAIINQYKKVVLINTEQHNIWSKLIYSLMINKEQYNIYETDKINIDSDYLEKVCKYENSLVDIKNYLGNSIDEPMSIVEYLTKLVDVISLNDTRTLIDTINSVRALGKQSVEFIKFIDGFNVELISRLNSKDNEIANSKKLITQLKEDVENRANEISHISYSIEVKDNEILELKQQIQDKTNEIVVINNQLSEKQDKINNILSQTNESLTDVEELVSQIESLKIELADKDNKMLEFKNQLTLKEEELKNMHQYGDKIEELSELIAQYETQIEQLKSQEEDAETLREALDSKEHEIDRLSSDIEKYENLSVDLDNLKNENEQYKIKMQEMTDEIETLKSQLEDTSNKTSTVLDEGISLEEIQKLREDNERLVERCNRYKTDIINLKASNDSFLDKLRNKAAGAMEFNPLLLNNNPKIKSRNILYFKEISYVTYTNTMLVKTLDLLLKKKQRVKMVIFDKPDEFSPSYQGLTIVNGDYARKKDDVLQKDIVVIMEPNMAILEDILSEQYTLVLIVDRLKCVKDLVIGNQVYKFWMVNSSSGIQSIMNMGSMSNDISSSSIITRPGVGHDTIGISKISDYPTFTEQAKSSKWYHLTNINAKNNENNNSLVIATILGRCGINIRGRR